MNDIEKRKLADQADMIVNGYAYTPRNIFASAI